MGSECAELFDLLGAYVDNELSDGDCQRLKAHLIECPSCLSEYERDALLKTLVRRSCQCEVAPSTLRASILTRITTVAIDGRVTQTTTSITAVTEAE